MGHYDIGEWADYVRDLLSGSRRRDLEQHLADGCEECGALVGFLRNVASTAATDQKYQEASAGLVAAAREIFPGQRQGAEHTGILGALRAVVAQLNFDSAAQLYSAGARGQRASGRQLMYQAGGYCVDLRVDRERNDSRVILVGQIADESQPFLQLARLPIFVMAGSKIVSETASNEFGEFTVEFPPRANLRLCVQVTQAGFQLEVPLKRALEEI